MNTAAAFVLFAPLVAAVIALGLPRSLAAVGRWLCIGTMAACSAAAVWLCSRIVPGGQAVEGPQFTWIDLGHLAFGGGILLDPLSTLMSALVCVLATGVLIFTTWYLHDDDLEPRFHWQMCFFVFAMLMVVLSDNLLMSFIGWELVGLGSYLLIGFWWFKPAVADDPGYQRLKGGDGRGVLEHRLSPSHAQFKAFVMNRVGDAGFLAGIGLFLAAALAAPGADPEPLHWASLYRLAESGGLPGGLFGLTQPELLTLAGLCLFCGAIGKSAQFPLHTWLPDAMQGPTTASSIIHAATMVAAGVYLCARAYPLLTPDALTVVGWVGAITCLMSATIACVQWDLKAVLAYSTLSQLGLMFVGLGAGAAHGGDAAAMSHLFTHAIFKNLLFLCAAAIIHGCGGCQDINRCGGLLRQMPITAGASLVAVLAIAGTPFFSASYSKDAVLSAAYGHAVADGTWVAWTPFLMACWASMLTAVYMLRWWLRIFLKRRPQAGKPCCGHSHDPSPRAWLVLVALTPLCLALPWTWNDWLHTALGAAAHAHDYHHTALLAFILGTVGASVALLLFWILPELRGIDAVGWLNRRLRPFYVGAAELWGFDRLWDALFVRGVGQGLAALAARLDLGRRERLEALDGGDPWFASRWGSIDGLIDAVGRGCARLGALGGAFHAGRLGAYIAAMAVVGAVILLLKGLL